MEVVSLTAEISQGSIQTSEGWRATEQTWGILFDSVSRNPNGEGLPHWPEYDEKEGYLQIGATTQQAQRLKAEEVAFWTELLAKNPPETDPTEHTEHKWMGGSASLRTSGAKMELFHKGWLFTKDGSYRGNCTIVQYHNLKINFLLEIKSGIVSWAENESILMGVGVGGWRELLT